MTRLATTPAILGILVGGMLAASLAAGCGSNKVEIGSQNVDAQASAPDAAAGRDAPAGGNGGSATGGATGGVVGAGGVAPTGGTVGAGGATLSGGTAGVGSGGSGGAGGSKVTASGGTTASGGSKASGGTIGTGGTNPSGGTGGSGTGCAPGWTLCCGQCLSPMAGVCLTPCPATGGAGPTGGATGTGGSTRTGGATGTGGTGGSTGKTCGGLVGLPCATGEFCEMPAGTCNVADGFGTCVVNTGMGCVTVYQPVCGCDGHTYPSDCDRRNAGVSKNYDGACATADAGVCPAGQRWCPGCTPGTGSCSVVCSAAPCPAPDAGTPDADSASCGQVTNQAACDARSDCHSVFQDLGTCGCMAVGCCIHFNRCADGSRATCVRPSTFACTIVQSQCVAPYVTSYTSNCYEGCVLPSECAVSAPGCPFVAPTNGASCSSPGASCFYDNCPSTGRTQATCTGGTWAAQTAACSSVSCVGMSCPSGQLCLIMEGGARIVQCVNNACGQGPVAPECGTPPGLCSVNATLTGGVTITCNTCSYPICG